MDTHQAILSRTYLNNCTIGHFRFCGFECKTLELPNLDNKQYVSCIPEGIYRCKKIKSPSLGECIEVQNVENRTFIRIHSGNFTREIRGCILVGLNLTDFDGDGITDVTNSKATLKKMLDYMPNQFNMEIKS